MATARSRRATCSSLPGSSPSRPPIAGDAPRWESSTRTAHSPSAALPERVLVIGAGAVGCEWAAVLRGFGVEVVLAEMAGQVLPSEDATAAKVLERSLASRGIDVRTGVEVAGVERAGRRSRGVGQRTRRDRRPRARRRGSAPEHRWPRPRRARCGPRRERLREDGRDDAYIGRGDQCGRRRRRRTAPRAQGRARGVRRGRSSGGRSTRRFATSLVPSVTYTSPEVASVGMTLDAARQNDPSSEAHSVPFGAIGRAVATGHSEGFAQLVTSGAHHRVVGGQIVGPNAGDLIAEVALAVELEATLADLAATMHAHPTHSEVLHEIALAGLGLPLHVSHRGVRCDVRTCPGLCPGHAAARLPGHGAVATNGGQGLGSRSAEQGPVRDQQCRARGRERRPGDGDGPSRLPRAALPGDCGPRVRGHHADDAAVDAVRQRRSDRARPPALRLLGFTGAPRALGFWPAAQPPHARHRHCVRGEVPRGRRGLVVDLR